MRIVCILLLFSDVIIDSIELSSQSSLPSDDGQDPSSQQCGPSSSTAAEPPLRERSKSPNLRQTFSTVLGFRFEDLEFMRLVPHDNPHRIFQLKSYVFPPNEPLRLRKKNHVFYRIPTKEQVVLSTLDGEACAILDKTTCKHTILRAIFTPADKSPERVKINIYSGAVERLTKEEIAQCPVSSHKQVTKYYKVSRLSSATTSFPGDDLNPGVHHSGSSPLSTTGRNCSPTAGPLLRDRSESPPLRQIFWNILGYRFEDLALIRFNPRSNPHRIFELRIYVFPPDKQIGLRTRNFILDTIPLREQIVLSTSDGDVCAVLRKTSNKTPLLRPIFSPTFGVRQRVKINMSSGAIRELTKEEIVECPVTAEGQITKFYRVYRLEPAAL